MSVQSASGIVEQEEPSPPPTRKMHSASGSLPLDEPSVRRDPHLICLTRPSLARVESRMRRWRRRLEFGTASRAQAMMEPYPNDSPAHGRDGEDTLPSQLGKQSTGGRRTLLSHSLAGASGSLKEEARSTDADLAASQALLDD